MWITDRRTKWFREELPKTEKDNIKPWALNDINVLMLMSVIPTAADPFHFDMDPDPFREIMSPDPTFFLFYFFMSG